MTKIILCMYEVVKRIIKSNLNFKNKVIIVLFLMIFSGCVCVHAGVTRPVGIALLLCVG